MGWLPGGAGVGEAEAEIELGEGEGGEVGGGKAELAEGHFELFERVFGGVFGGLDAELFSQRVNFGELALI